MSQPTNPQAANPELALGDILRFAQALAEAVLTGSGQVPVLKMKVAGKNIKVGPTPVEVE
jgi:hypothetical protein